MNAVIPAQEEGIILIVLTDAGERVAAIPGAKPLPRKSGARRRGHLLQGSCGYMRPLPPGPGAVLLSPLRSSCENPDQDDVARARCPPHVSAVATSCSRPFFWVVVCAWTFCPVAFATLQIFLASYAPAKAVKLPPESQDTFRCTSVTQQHSTFMQVYWCHAASAGHHRLAHRFFDWVKAAKLDAVATSQCWQPCISASAASIP